MNQAVVSIDITGPPVVFPTSGSCSLSFANWRPLRSFLLQLTLTCNWEW